MFNAIIDIFSRAQQNKALTANERSFIKACKGALYGMLINAVPQLSDVMLNHGTFNVSQSALSALVGAFILALIKLMSAQSDPEIGVILDALAQQKEQQALDALTTPASADGSIPVWQITVPAVKATALRVTMPINAPTVMNPVPPRASKMPPGSPGAFKPPLYTLGTTTAPVPAVSAPISRLSVPPDPHDLPTAVVPAVNLANDPQA